MVKIENTKSSDIIPYDDLLAKLERYPFSQKMQMAQVASRQIMTMTGVDLAQTGKPLPWELELFVALSILTNTEFCFELKSKQLICPRKYVQNEC